MSGRILTGRSGDSSFSYEDQEKAMLAGFNSVAEWAVVELVKRYQDLAARVEALENGNSTVVFEEEE